MNRKINMNFEKNPGKKKSTYLLPHYLSFDAVYFEAESYH